MDHSLINPNQIQITGMPLSDNQFDENQKRTPKFCDFASDIIMGVIGDVFVKQMMKKRLVTGINVHDVKVNEMESKTENSVITPDEVSWKFSIRIEKAKDTVIVATQKGIRRAVHILHRIYQVYHMQLSRNHLNSQLYTDHLLTKTKYLEIKMGSWIL